MDLAHFREQLHSFLDLAGKNQKELASLLLMHPNVLSRKLNHTNNSKFTRPEVKQLILVLAQWGCFTRRNEIDHFLALLDFNSQNLFTEKEWTLPALNELEKDSPVTVPENWTGKQKIGNGWSGPPVIATTSLNTSKTFPTLSSILNNLPRSLPGLLGRNQEIIEIEEILTSPETQPLLTLTGTGGCGKTRLALAVAEKLLSNSRFSGGVYFVRLENITSQNELIDELVNTLNIKDQQGKTQVETLRNHLSKQPHLIVMDNFEQLVEASPVLVDLLKFSPETKFLVTSRVPLQLSLEREFQVKPLALPPPQDILKEADLDRLNQYPAIALFSIRARAVNPDFILNTQNMAAVTEICRKVDGLPLALELAAARIRTFNPHELLERLNLKLLSGGARDLTARQQTLRGTIDWSYNLLSQDEQVLFARLSIFVGGFTLEAAEVVCNSGDEFGLAIETYEGINSLLLKNLLKSWKDKSGSTRFGMLQTIMEYGQEKLQESGKYNQLFKYYADYYLNLAKEKEVQLKGGDQLVALEILDSEYDNLRNILSKVLGQGEARAEATFELAAALGEFWNLRGYLFEGRKYLEQVLSLSQAHQNAVTKSSRAKVLNILGAISNRQGDHQVAKAYFETSIELSRESQDKSELAFALNKLNDFAADRGDFAGSKRYLEETLKVAGECSDKRVIVSALHDSSTIYLFYIEDYARSLQLMQESLALAHKIGDKRGTIFGLNGLGHIAMYFKNDYATALKCFEEALAQSIEIVDTRCVWYSFLSLGILAYNQAEYTRATEFFEKSLEISRKIGDRRSIYYCLKGLAKAALEAGENSKAHQYLEEGEALSRKLGVILSLDMFYKV